MTEQPAPARRGRLVWPRLLRYATGNRRVPADRMTRARLGTWGWLTGRDLWREDMRGARHG